MGESSRSPFAGIAAVYRKTGIKPAGPGVLFEYGQGDRDEVLASWPPGVLAAARNPLATNKLASGFGVDDPTVDGVAEILGLDASYIRGVTDGWFRVLDGCQEDAPGENYDPDDEGLYAEGFADGLVCAIEVLACPDLAEHVR